MSRALGAAFLGHQVEQLERSAGSGNWRSRTPNPQQASRANHGRGKAGTTKTVATAEPALLNKDADVVVVDASVLVHAIHQVKKWCRDGCTEIVIVPLEALNTLDLLKKGTSAVAQRARAASRILEAQVGSNPRIRVQRDDAFAPWDTITFSSLEPSPAAATPEATDGPTPVAAAPLPVESAPEWVRRTVCCARWQVENVDSTAASADSGSDKPQPRTVCLAIAASTPAPASAADGPVNKHEPRATGTLVSHWAARAGVKVLPVACTEGNRGDSTPAQGASPIGIQSPRRPRAGTAPKPGGGGASFMGEQGRNLVEGPALAFAMEAPGPRHGPTHTKA
ncbi:hypothetical protein FB45DRAFT_818788 [Roridomyces roridus]|uniref:PIN domain-containing protein n=1 Tax=Roridomyces roridus TaxID=1738132 RepID=A0AAD7FXY0_9AGAR|nr:hypothetical protein FB45DRAFT_818788 [Roridomyces roridus]